MLAKVKARELNRDFMSTFLHGTQSTVAILLNLFVVSLLILYATSVHSFEIPEYG